MDIERDYTAERLAEIEVLLAEATRTKAGLAPTERIRARQLTAELDEMLKELRGPNRAFNIRA